MIFTGFPRMVGLSFFPRLCQLTIIGQDIKHMEGLESCPLLQELWVVECHLTEISGLQGCPQLQKLYLYDNKICEIKNLDSQINVEVLWLNNNCITQIQGLSTLQNLKELNLADNCIEQIGHSLDPNVSLQNLNLSGNKISSFKELAPLARLPHLKELALNDPTSTPDPVCLLWNYATHVLYHMPALQRLDMYDISSKQVKEAAEVTVIKKMMYYNMRVHTAQRHLAETRLNLLEKKKTLSRLPEEHIRTLDHNLKNLERELCKKSTSMLKDGIPHAVEYSTNRSDPTTDTSCDLTMEQKIQRKIEVLRERLVLWTRRLDEFEAWYERSLAKATSMMECNIQFLLMELESVGNIRLEEGCDTDSWFTSCQELMLSRFSSSDYKPHSITGIKISRVIRIQNSALRLRFDEKLKTVLAREESVNFYENYRRRLEHLFYIADPEKTDEKEELLCILEEGFKSAKEYKASGREEAVPLSNSLIVAEQPRIDYVFHQAQQDPSTDPTDTIPFRQGHVILSKVFLGHSAPIREGETIERGKYPRESSVYLNVDTKQRTSVKRLSSSPETPTASECSPRRRHWFVFDHELILPEYVIYFEYITEEPDLPAPLHHYTDKCDQPSRDTILDGDTLSMEPVLKPQPKLLSLDEKILLSVAGANVLSQITVLNLHSNSLSKMKEISRLTALRHLTISFNEFTCLDDISHMPNLEFLDVSYNRLVTLEGLRGLGQLKQLDVRWNKLTNAKEDTAVLRKHTPGLLKLDTRHNPWSRPDTIRMTILGRLSTLTHLDGVLVTEEEAAEAVRIAAGSKINRASLLAYSRTDRERPRSLSLLSTAQLLCRLSPAPWGLSQDLEPDWTAKITALSLDNQRISKLINLNTLVNLRWASFNDNIISKVEGLECCLKLEELSLNNNNINTLNGLPKLPYLNKLSVNGNKLSSVEASVLDQLPNMSFLSMENNYITSLHGIQRARSLLELYIGNNQISTSRDIYYLKGLTSLIILDLYGNPLLERLENYRIYVVFHLPSLKALDGFAVEVTECESAKDMFGGRLTADMVGEKLGHSNYCDITYLTLQSCFIRMVDLSPSEMFVNLQSVNLDHNNLTSFSGLIYLPNIKALCLNYNHIESILPRQKTHLTNRQMLHSKVHSSGYGKQNLSRGNRDAEATGSLEPLMGSLEVLHLSHNGISNMANLQLSRLTNLKALFLRGNDISQVEGLEGLHQLRHLVLDRNRIKALAENSFISQNVLLELHLAENRIRELNHLYPLMELRVLYIGMNKLQDIMELEKLEILPSLTELSLVGNPVARNSLHRPTVVLHLPQLQVLDGVTVTLEERTRAELLSADGSQCTQCPGAFPPAGEINLPGVFPIMPHTAPLRGMNVSGLQNFVHGHDNLPSNVDEAHPHYMYNYKKHKHSNAARSYQTDTAFRHIRRTGGHLPASGVPFQNREQDNRFPNDGKPPPE
ncbi:leucine-rich repeat-containing protein 9 [Aulostomus maculatus]